MTSFLSFSDAKGRASIVRARSCSVCCKVSEEKSNDTDSRSIVQDAAEQQYHGGRLELLLKRPLLPPTGGRVPG